MYITHWPVYTGPNKDFEGAIDRVKYILSKVGNPHLKLKNVIHITGTKGKGSTALYISNILRSSGYKVNTYTSPHIYECNERVLLNGIQITDDEIYSNTEAIRVICEEGENRSNPIEPAMFEVMTCCAFMSMAQNDADFNVIEVGMGARFDATNVFDDNPPLACVFTPIHLDHTKFLGNRIEEVAVNKSFLIKKGVENVVLSSQAKESKDVLKKVASDFGVENVLTYGEDYEVFREDGANRPFFESEKFDVCMPFPEPNMTGDYQLINCGCAIATCLAVQNCGFADNLSYESIGEGIKRTINIVRMEKITSGKLFEKLPKGSVFYVDGAHNQLASHALAGFINEFKAKPENKDFKIAVAVARTKGVNNEAFLEELLDKYAEPIVDLLICTRANMESIPEPPEIIAEAGEKLGFNYSVAYNIEEVVEDACEIAENQPVLLICTGSLYIARDIHFYNNDKR